jgi:hypothetical protein
LVAGRGIKSPVTSSRLIFEYDIERNGSDVRIGGLAAAARSAAAHSNSRLSGPKQVGGLGTGNADLAHVPIDGHVGAAVAALRARAASGSGDAVDLGNAVRDMLDAGVFGPKTLAQFSVFSCAAL